MTKIKTTLNPHFSSSRRGLNPYFSFQGENGSNSNEVEVMHSMQKEQIQIYGVSCKYIVRTHNTLDELFGESIGSNFSHSFDIEMIPEDATALMQGTDTLQRFGYNMTDTITLQCSFNRIIDEIEALGIEGRTYPLTGDLIAFGIPGNILEIRYIEDKTTSFAMGAYALYSFTCQVFDYSGETFNTSDDDVDEINTYNELYVEPAMDNDFISNEAENKMLPEENTKWETLTGRTIKNGRFY